MHLRARSAERPVEKLGILLNAVSARIRARRTDVELRTVACMASPPARPPRSGKAAAAPASAASPSLHAAGSGATQATVALPPVVAVRRPWRASASSSQ